VITFTASNSEI